MRKLSWIIYITSAIITAILFYVINRLTEPVLIGGSKSNISNGNPGLFPILFIMPFLIVLIMGTFLMANRFAIRTFKTRQFKFVLLLALFFPSAIYFWTIQEANALRLVVFANNDSVTKISEIPLLNPYSNSLFFNEWTFLALIVTIIFFAYMVALIKQSD